MRLITALLGAAGLVIFGGQARAGGDLAAGAGFGWGAPHDGRENGPLVEVRYRASEAPLTSWVELAGEPRHIGFAAVGASTRWDMGPRFYVEHAEGVGIHFGDRGRDFGSVGLFALQLAAGWRIDPKTSAEVAIEHWSNAWQGRDDGLNDVTLRFVRRF